MFLILLFFSRDRFCLVILMVFVSFLEWILFFVRMMFSWMMIMRLLYEGFYFFV